MDRLKNVLELKNGLFVFYYSTEMSGDVYKLVNSKRSYLIDISNGFNEIDFHTVAGDFEPCTRATDEYQPKLKVKSNNGKLEYMDKNHVDDEDMVFILKNGKLKKVKR